MTTLHLFETYTNRMAAVVVDWCLTEVLSSLVLQRKMKNIELWWMFYSPNLLMLCGLAGVWPGLIPQYLKPGSFAWSFLERWCLWCTALYHFQHWIPKCNTLNWNVLHLLRIMILLQGWIFNSRLGLWKMCLESLMSVFFKVLRLLLKSIIWPLAEF